MGRYNRPDEPTRYIDARAPMADTSKNNPMSQSTMTPVGAWDNMFRNRLTGTNPVGQEAGRDTSLQTAANSNPVASGGVNGGAPSIAQTVLSGILPNPFNDKIQLGVGGAKTVPSISQSLAGDQNHAQAWGSNIPASLNTPTRGDGARIAAQYGDGPGSTTFSNKPNRVPYIGGANGDMTKDFIAGGKYSSAAAGSDPTINNSYAFRTLQGARPSGRITPIMERIDPRNSPLSGFRKMQSGNPWPFSIGA